MLKWISFFIFFSTSSPDLQTIRDLYQKAPEDESKTIELINKLQGSDIGTTLQGYKGAATMLMAKHAFNPYQKVKYFNEGKAILEKAIQSDKNNIELRYLRYTIQVNAPSFLGYQSNMNEDKTFLQQHVEGVTDTYLKTKIVSFLNRK